MNSTTLEKKQHRLPGITYFLCAGLLVLIVACCAMFAFSESLLVRYYVSVQVSTDNPHASGDVWLMHRANIAMPILISHLRKEDETSSRRAGIILSKMLAEHQDPMDPSDSHFTMTSAMQLNHEFSQMPPQGRLQSIQLAYTILEIHLSKWSPTVPSILANAGNIVMEGLSAPEPNIVCATLEEMPRIWTWAAADGTARGLIDEWKSECYTKVALLLDNRDDHIRESASHAMMNAPFYEEEKKLMGLLNDPSARVRKAALKSLACADVNLLTSECREELTRFLHDPDSEVRETASQIFLKSGISPANLTLGTKMNDPSPDERAKVPAEVIATKGVNPIPYFQTLANDKETSVRRAVAKAAASSSVKALHDLLKRMCDSESDPKLRAEFQILLATNRK